MGSGEIIIHTLGIGQVYRSSAAQEENDNTEAMKCKARSTRGHTSHRARSLSLFVHLDSSVTFAGDGTQKN